LLSGQPLQVFCPLSSNTGLSTPEAPRLVDMKTTLLVAAALAASVNGVVIENRQIGGGRPTGRPGSGTGDGIAAPVHERDPQRFSIGRPTASVTFFPNDPGDDRV
jgi:hypothetical protein